MNEARRKLLRYARSQLDDVNTIFSQVSREESYALSNMPESFEGTDRYEKMEAAVDALDDINDCMREIYDSLDEIMY